jgi:Mitochondrial carrier protein
VKLFLTKPFQQCDLYLHDALKYCEQWLLERRRNNKPGSYTNSSYSNGNSNNGSNSNNGATQTALQRHASNVIPSKMSMTETFLAGSFAGACQMAIVLPADNIKTKLQVSAHACQLYTLLSTVYMTKRVLS